MSTNGKRPPCKAPDCTYKVKIDGKYGLCAKHEEWMDFLLFALPHIKMIKGTPVTLPPPGLILPR